MTTMTPRETVAENAAAEAAYFEGRADRANNYREAAKLRKQANEMRRIVRFATGPLAAIPYQQVEGRGR